LRLGKLDVQIVLVIRGIIIAVACDMILGGISLNLDWIGIAIGVATLLLLLRLA
jgi:hypothetical protein